MIIPNGGLNMQKSWQCPKFTFCTNSDFIDWNKVKWGLFFIIFALKMNNVTFLCQYLGQKLRFEKISLQYWKDSDDSLSYWPLDPKQPLINQIRKFNILMTPLTTYLNFSYVLIAKSFLEIIRKMEKRSKIG